MAFQENLRYYREKAGYKQAKEFAKVLGITYTTYVGYENKGREPKYDTLCKIADLLNVSTDELLGRKNNIIGANEDERLKESINKMLLTAYADSEVPFLIRSYKIEKNSIYLNVGYKTTDDSFDIENIEVPKDLIIDGINHVNFSVSKRQRLLTFERIATFALDIALDKCERETVDFTNKWCESKVFDNQIDKIVSALNLTDKTNGLNEIENILHDKTKIKEKAAFEELKKETHELLHKDLSRFFDRGKTILDYQKVLQDFISSNK